MQFSERLPPPRLKIGTVSTNKDHTNRMLRIIEQWYYSTLVVSTTGLVVGLLFEASQLLPLAFFPFIGKPSESSNYILPVWYLIVR